MTPFLKNWVEIYRPHLIKILGIHSDLLFFNQRGNQWDSRVLKDFVRCECVKVVPSYWNGSPRSLRFLQSAWHWKLREEGKISDDDWKNLLAAYDRTEQTWYASYRFGEDIANRVVNDANRARIQDM